MEFDETQFQTRLKFRIPADKSAYGDEYHQYAILDLIEYMAENMKDISESWNSKNYKNYWRIECLPTAKIYNVFQREINQIFADCGLLYNLTSEKKVVRVLEYSILTPEVETVIQSIKEKGLKDLLEEAVTLFRRPDPAFRNDALEKLWDAFERLKTYYTELDKKESAAKIVTSMSDGQPDFAKLLEDEFRALTAIGNNFRIRHHETDKVDITDTKHCDYLFNRCMSLIALALQCLD